jgi:hypothetical protein
MSNLSDIDIDNLGESPPLPKEGIYHIKLVSHTESINQKGTRHQLKWQIVGTNAELHSELGKYVYDSLFSYSSIFAKQIATLGYACGIYARAYLKSLQAKDEDLPMPDLHTWLYVSCIARVKHEADTNEPTKVYARLALYDQKPVNHPIVQEAGIVLDEASISNSVPEQAKNTDVF